MNDSREVVWHDVENASYDADLELWRELAVEESGPILDLGCGSGRVALDLARRGHRVTGVDRSERLVEALRWRAWELDLNVEVVEADACELDLGDQRFGLVLAPMQMLQVLSGDESRREVLRRAAAALIPGGLFAAAIVEGAPTETWEEGDSPTLPDVREEAGWVFSSLPVAVRNEPGEIVIERLRQTVSPDGELSEERDRVVLASLDAARLEAEARAAGLEPAGRREIGETEMHAPCTVVLTRSVRED
jgi:SAM-dependent methyltransferase